MTANVDANLANWSTTDAINQPDGTDTADIDAEFRRIQSTVRKYLATKGADIASASTVDLSAATGNTVTVTGTTTITALGTVSAGMRFTLIFDNALTLTHNGTSLILPGAANITTAAGDTAEFLSLGSGNWRCLRYSAASGVTYTPAGTGAVTTTVQDKLREFVSVKDFGAVGDGVTDDTAAIQAAIDYVATLGGGIVWFPVGNYALSDCVIVRASQGITLQGESMVKTIVQSLSASHPTHNALIAVDIQPMNGAIKNMRLRTGNAGFTGWGIVAGTSTTGKNLVSTEIANIWCDFATNSAGFFFGGLYDCWIHHCQFENLRYRFKLEGVSSCGNRNIFSDINDIGGRNPFLETPALQNTGMMFNNITVSSVVGQAVLASRNWWLDLQSSDGYVISNIRFESGSSFDPATSYAGFIRMRDCENMLIDGCVVEVDEFVGTNQVAGLYISDCEAIISDTRMRNNSAAFARVFNPIEIAGSSNRLKFNNLEVVGAETNSINFTGSAMAGSVEFVGCTFTKAKARLLSDTNQNHTMDVRFKDCTLINPHWGGDGAASKWFFVLGTSGATEFIGCTIGRDLEGETANASNPGRIWRITGTGTGKIEACTVQRFDLAYWHDSTVTQRLPSSIVLGYAALADDGVITLPSRTAGVATVQCGNESAVFVFGTTAGSVTKVAGTTNTIAGNVDNNLCAYWAGANTNPTISNRLGAANRITIRYEFT